jgi:hypothetical protein
MIRNLSLTLLNAQSAPEVLDIFSRDILKVDMFQNTPELERRIYLEELLILLHFFKA